MPARNNMLANREELKYKGTVLDVKERCGNGGRHIINEEARMKPGTLITAQAAAILSKHGQVAETFSCGPMNPMCCELDGAIVVGVSPPDRHGG
jgi:hypothetical protein